MSVVLVIGDTHCPGMRAGYVDFLKRIADKHAATRVVHIGDLVDWAAISYHEKHPALCGVTDERKRAKRQVDQLVKAFPRADWMIGNHDALPERKAVTAGLDPKMLRDPAEYWEIEWRTHPRFSKLEIDGALYAHGDSGAGGKFAALNQAKENFASTIIGHLHAQGGVSYWANARYRVFGMSVGTGVDNSRLQFEYGRRYPAKPMLGCGVVVGGKRAIFEPWLLKSRA